MPEDIQKLLLGAASMGNATFVRKAIESGVDTTANGSEALYAAAERGNVECVRLLIPVSDPDDYASALNMAAFEGHIECVRLLI